MTTLEQARDALISAFRAAWLANPTSAPVALEYDDVRTDTDASPTAATRRVPYGKVTVVPFPGELETMGAIGGRRFLETCSFVLQLFTAPGDGRKSADTLAQIAKSILRRLRDPNGVWTTGSVEISALGISDGMQQTNVSGEFKYQERD